LNAKEMAVLLEVLIMLVVGGLIAAICIWLVLLIRRKPLTGVESLVDARGFVYSERLGSAGEVSIDGVVWKARLADPSVDSLGKGDKVVVKRVENITLLVERS
jgi:membrane protein implicated in regulation of membrane protease activity